MNVPEVFILKVPLALYFGNVNVFKSHCEELIRSSQVCHIMSVIHVTRALLIVLLHKAIFKLTQQINFYGLI